MSENHGQNAVKRSVKFQDLTRLHTTVKPEIYKAFDKIFESSAFIQGEPVKRFEKEFSEYTGAKHSIGVANGTDAIEIVVEALGITKGDLVAMPSLTFAATAEAVARAGATPLFIEVDENTANISPAKLRESLQKHKNVKALIMVHLYGRACDVDGLMKVAKEFNLKVIEDCAQAHGASIAGKHVGTFGDAATFSFYPGKNLGAFGDGGMIITNDDSISDKCKLIRDHGRTGKYFHVALGRNSRLDALQAEFLSVKLKKLTEWNNKRIALADRYHEKLQGIKGLELFSKPKDPNGNVYHLFVVKVTHDKFNRDDLSAYLKSQGIETLIHYPYANHSSPAFEKLSVWDSLALTENLTKKILSLPMDPLHTAEDVDYVAGTIKRFYEQN